MPILALVLLLVLAPATYSQIPSSKRSGAAIKKIQPRLVKQFQKEGLEYGSPVYVRIFKESMELEIWIKKGSTYRLFKTYEICSYGSQGLGPKLKEGDGKAPEGFYRIHPHSLNPYSSFHLSFNLGYPNAYDRAHKRTGSALMVHGGCCSVGCYAMTDTQIEEIYAIIDTALRKGQKAVPVHIFPFRMTRESLHRYKDSPWHSFWKTLKTGYDLFEQSKVPPGVTVRKGEYIASGE
ncbi:MAG: L,D-transpeptidase family protein [Fibrobacterota bacterium]